MSMNWQIQWAFYVKVKYATLDMKVWSQDYAAFCFFQLSKHLSGGLVTAGWPGVAHASGHQLRLVGKPVYLLPTTPSPFKLQLGTKEKGTEKEMYTHTDPNARRHTR